MPKQALGKSIFIFAMVSLFLIYEMAMQVSPGIITQQLMQDLKLDALGLGLMSGFYFYTYTGAQLISGLLYDRFHVRSVLIIPLIICAYGAYLFGLADSLQDGAIARMMMGFGGAFAFIGLLVVASDVFPPRRFALAAGVAQLLAAIGAIFGEAPLLPIINSFGWRTTMHLISYTGFFIAILLWIFVRYPRKEEITQNAILPLSTFTSLKKLLGTSQNWFIAIYACVLWVPMSAFASLWGVPFLISADKLSHPQAASVMIFMWLGVGLISPLLGWWSNHIGKRKIPVILVSFLGLVATSILVFIPELSVTLVSFLLFVAGGACSGQVLMFAVAKENNIKENHALAIAFTNMAVVISGAIFQPLVGKLIQTHWQGTISNGAPLYTLQDYQLGLSLVPLALAIGFIVSLFFIKETGCRLMSEGE